MIRKNIMTELDKGNNVIMVCHSWGGIPSVSALRDLDSAARKGAGFDSSVVGLAAISSFIVLEGQSVLTSKGPYTETDKGVSRKEGGLAIVKEPGPVHWFYHDLPFDEADKWAATLYPHSLAALVDTSKHTPYDKIPTHYLICKQDRAIVEGLQRHFVQQLRDQGFHVRTEEVDASHSPFLSEVEKTSDFLRRCAGEQVP